MDSLFITLMAIAMLATLVALFIGLFAFAKGGDFNKKHGNRLMRVRVLLQGIALALFAVALLSQTGG